MNKDLQYIIRRPPNLHASYAASFRGQSLIDEKGNSPIDKATAIGQMEANRTSTSPPNQREVLPHLKITRCLDIENKMWAIVKGKLAQGVPFVELHRENLVEAL